MGFDDVTIPTDEEEQQLFTTDSEETPRCTSCGGESEESKGYGYRCKASPDECEVLLFVPSSYSSDLTASE